SRSHDDVGNSLLVELEHERCDEVDWHAAFGSRFCGCVRAECREIFGAARASYEVARAHGEARSHFFDVSARFELHNKIAPVDSGQYGDMPPHWGLFSLGAVVVLVVIQMC